MSAAKKLNLTLKVWRQKNGNAKGSLETYPLKDISPDSSFLEMLDILNNELINKGEALCHSIMIVEKVFVVLVHYILMESLMVRQDL